MKIAVVWEGVLYAGPCPGLDGADFEFDEPLVPGAIEWLAALRAADNAPDIVICSAWYSTLCPLNPVRFENAMRSCLVAGGLPRDISYGLDLWADEGIPVVDVFVSTRCYRFSGTHPSGADMQAMKPWGDLLVASIWVG